MVANLAGTAASVGLKQITGSFGFAVIGCLGQLPFFCAQILNKNMVLTFNDLTRENAVRWARHDVLGKKPILEYVGEDLSKVSLSIRFDTSLGIPPLVGLAHLKKMLENKKYKTLIIGGEYLGKYVIESISETRKFHTGAGVCQVATATVNLIEFATNTGKDDMINDFFGQFE